VRKLLGCSLRQIAVLGSIIFGFAPSAQAFLGDLLFVPPHDSYRVRHTDHFKVIYPKALSREAEKTCDTLEHAHTVLKKVYDYEPGHKVTIILTDNQDFANGVTSAVGQQGIILLMTYPDPYRSNGEYDYWLENLIIHEYSHYLTLEQTRGLFSLSRIFFGNLIFPNHAWPSWLAEGLAVHAESTFTKQGRGHGTYYDTLTRSAISSKNMGDEFLNFNRISEFIPDFPFGETSYYAGYALINQLEHEQGKEAPGRFAEESSWRIPYLNNGTLENIGGDSFQNLWKRWIEREEKRLAPELNWLSKNGAKEPELLTPDKTIALGTRLSPDETKIAYYLVTGHDRSAIRIRDLKTGEDKRIEDAAGSAALSWSPDSAALYYAKADFQGPFHLYSDLYRYDLNGGVTRITHGERAKDPDYCESKAGPGLVFTTQRARETEVRFVNLKTKEVHVLYRAPEEHHVSTPRCALDGSAVYFSQHGVRRLDSIQMLALDQQAHTKGTVVRIAGGNEDGFGSFFPEPSRDGSVYFTRLANNYYELARWNGHKVIPVSRSSGGYWFASIGRKAPDQSRMAVSYVSSKGIQVGLVNPRELERTVGQAMSENVKETSDLSPTTVIPVARKSEERGYNLLTSLQPRIWAPFISFSDYQKQFGGTILGWDDLDQLEYTLLGWYDTVSRKPEGAISTFHRISTFKIGLGASSQVSAYNTPPPDRDRGTFDEERKASIVIQRPFPGVFSSWVPGIVAEWARTWREDPNRSTRRVFDPEYRLGASLTHQNIERYQYSLGPEKGYRFNVEGRRFFVRSDRAWKGIASWQQFIRLFPEHSALDLKGTFGIAPNPLGNVPESALRVGGRGTLSDLDLSLRGYPLGNFTTQRVALLQAEYRVPLSQIFRGFGTFPLFIRNLGLFGFYDGATMEEDDGKFSRVYSGVGGGLLLNSAVGYAFPLQVRLEYARGLNKNQNGQDVFSLQINL